MSKAEVLVTVLFKDVRPGQWFANNHRAIEREVKIEPFEYKYRGNTFTANCVGLSDGIHGFYPDDKEVIVDAREDLGAWLYE